MTFYYFCNSFTNVLNKTEGLGIMNIFKSKVTKSNINFYKINLLLIFLLLINFRTHSQDIKGNLEAYWKLECNTNDNSGKNAKLKPINAPICIDAKRDKGYQLNGTNQYFELDSFATSKFISKEGFSWSLWVNGADLPTSSNKRISQSLIAIMDNELAQDIYLGFGDINWEEKTLVFRVDGQGGAGELNILPCIYNPSGGFKNNTWYHIAGVMDYKSKKSKLFVNGVKVDEKSVFATPIARNMYGSIGKAYDGKDVDSAYFNGILDEIRMYSKVLSDGEVKFLYNLRENQLKVENKVFNFGKLICSIDSTKNIPLINEGPTEFTIKSSKLLNGQYFSLSSENGFTANYSATDSIYNLPIRFRPDLLGMYYDTLILENDFDLPPLLVPIQAERDTIYYELANLPIDQNNTIDLGVLCPNLVKEIKFNINLLTQTDKEFYLVAPNSISILDKSIGIGNSIKGGENREVKLAFTAGSTFKLISDSLSLIDECGNELKYYLKADIYEPTYVLTQHNDTTICPQQALSFIAKIKNNSVRPIDWTLVSNNPLFSVPSNISIAPNEEYKLSIQFNGVDNGGLQKCNIVFDIGCGRLDSIHFDLNVELIDLAFANDTLDFGEILMCGNDSTLTKIVKLKNKNITEGIEVLQTFFDIETNISHNIEIGSKLALNEEKEFLVTLKLDKIGDYSNNISIEIDKCDFIVKLPVKAKVTYREVGYNKNVNLGELKENIQIDTTLNILNTGTVDFKVKSIQVNNYTYTLIGKQLNDKINPNDTIKIRLQTTSKAGFQLDSVNIITETTCGEFDEQFKISYLGRYIAKFEITPGINQVQSKGSMNLNLYLSNIYNLDSSKVDSVYVRYGFNKSIMLPSKNKNFINVNGNYVENEYRESLSKLQQFNNPYTQGLFFINLDSLDINLGDTPRDSIKIMEMSFTGGFAEPVVKNGYIWLSDICFIDGSPRLIGIDDNELFLGNPTPNPGNNEVTINYGLVEDGDIKIEFFDSSGNLILVPIDKYQKAGSYQLKLNTMELPLGTYFYTLTTRTGIVSKRMQILR